MAREKWPFIAHEMMRITVLLSGMLAHNFSLIYVVLRWVLTQLMSSRMHMYGAPSAVVYGSSGNVVSSRSPLHVRIWRNLHEHRSSLSYFDVTVFTMRPSSKTLSNLIDSNCHSHQSLL